MKAPKRKKKLAVGGTIKGYQQPIAEPEKLQTGIGAYAGDYGRLLLDSAAQPFGFNVKEERYKTALGKKGNKVVDQVGAVERQIAAGGLNFLAPGAGTLYNTATTGISQMQGSDEGLDANTQKNIEGINQVGGITNALFSLTGITKDNPKGIFAKNEDGEDDAGTPAKKAEGGQIVGKGGPKEDVISMKAESGGFVVPAENAGIANEIRKQFLGKNKKAPLKSGETDIKVSNGEHYFTRKEANFLTSIGIDLNALAPNAEDNSIGAHKKAYNGEDKPKRTTSTGNKEADKYIDYLYNGNIKDESEYKDILNKVDRLLGGGFNTNPEFQKAEQYLKQWKTNRSANEKLNEYNKQWNSVETILKNRKVSDADIAKFQNVYKKQYFGETNKSEEKQFYDFSKKHLKPEYKKKENTPLDTQNGIPVWANQDIGSTQGPTGTNATPTPFVAKAKDGIAGATSNTAKVQQQKAIDDKAKGQVIPASSWLTRS